MSIIVKGSGGGGGENITAELDAQAILLQEIEESLVGKASGANITPETVLKGYAGYKGKELVEGTYDPATADPNLIPENIREGVDIFGIIGTMVEGVSGIDYGEVTLTAQSKTITISHNLNKKPTRAYLLPYSLGSTSTSQIQMMVTATSTVFTNSGTAVKEAGTKATSGFAYATAKSTISEDTVVFNGDDKYFPTGTYKWLVVE